MYRTLCLTAVHFKEIKHKTKQQQLGTHSTYPTYLQAADYRQNIRAIDLYYESTTIALLALGSTADTARRRGPSNARAEHMAMIHARKAQLLGKPGCCAGLLAWASNARHDMHTRLALQSCSRNSLCFLVLCCNTTVVFASTPAKATKQQ
jgi:hypothetical protein